MVLYYLRHNSFHQIWSVSLEIKHVFLGMLIALFSQSHVSDNYLNDEIATWNCFKDSVDSISSILRIGYFRHCINCSKYLWGLCKLCQCPHSLYPREDPCCHQGRWIAPHWGRVSSTKLSEWNRTARLHEETSGCPCYRIQHKAAHQDPCLLKEHPSKFPEWAIGSHGLLRLSQD